MIKKKFGLLFYFEPKSKIKAGAGSDKGEYPFYTSSGNLTKKVEIAQYRGNSLIFGTGGQPSVHFSLVPFSTSTDCVVATPRTKEVNPQYVYYFLKGNMYILQRGFRGAGLKHISKSYIERIEIPVISLEQQNQIVGILEKTEKLIESHKQSIETLEALIKSVFLDMFGDPKSNSKEWQYAPIKNNFGFVVTGNTPPREKKEYYEPKFIEWIKTDNISNREIVLTAKEYLSEEGAAIGRVVDPNALLVTCIAGSLNSIGNAALTDRTVAFNQQINAIVPNKDIEPLFLYYLFKYSKDYIQRFARKGLKLIITKGEFEKIKLIRPPHKLQKKFADIAEKIIKHKLKAVSSLELSETLFKSLLQKAFRGEVAINNTEYLFQKAIVELNWLEEQLGLLQPYGFSSDYIKKLAEIRDDEEIDSLSVLERTLQENRFPTIEEVISLKELLYSFDIPFLPGVKEPDQIQRLISHSVFRDTNIREVFEKLQEKNSLEQIEKQIVRESNPVFRYIGEMHYQAIPAENKQMSLARFIYESFQDKEFTIGEVAERLKSEKAIPGIKAGNVKENVFSLLKEFIRTEFYEYPFTFQDLSRQLREKLFHPSFELLHEFIVEELDKREGLRQMYYPGEMQKLYPGHFQRLQAEKATNKLYLIATYGNRQN